jgi:hypothetical protein
VVSNERTSEVRQLLEHATQWVASQHDVVAAAVLGSWARDTAREDSDIDLILLTNEPVGYTAREAWISQVAPGATLIRTGNWGPIIERRLRLPSGLEIEVGIGPPTWARTDPVDPGTRRVVLDGLRVLHDPHGLLGALMAAC